MLTIAPWGTQVAEKERIRAGIVAEFSAELLYKLIVLLWQLVIRHSTVSRLSTRQGCNILCVVDARGAKQVKTVAPAIEDLIRNNLLSLMRRLLKIIAIIISLGVIILLRSQIQILKAMTTAF